VGGGAATRLQIDLISEDGVFRACPAAHPGGHAVGILDDSPWLRLVECHSARGEHRRNDRDIEHRQLVDVCARQQLCRIQCRAPYPMACIETYPDSPAPPAHIAEPYPRRDPVRRAPNRRFR
jgi:hypothetical protein